MSGMRTIGVSQRPSDLQKKKKNVGVFDPALHPRCWAQLIHEFICHQRVGSCRDEEIKDGAIGVTKVLFSLGECSFDSGHDKVCCPGSFESLRLCSCM
jgi:hypothetical protein